MYSAFAPLLLISPPNLLKLRSLYKWSYKKNTLKHSARPRSLCFRSRISKQILLPFEWGNPPSKSRSGNRRATVENFHTWFMNHVTVIYLRSLHFSDRSINYFINSILSTLSLYCVFGSDIRRSTELSLTLCRQFPKCFLG